MGLLQKKDILLIDDSEDILLLGRKILEADGAIVHTASSVKMAKEILTGLTPHIIISDLEMNDQDGFDFLSFRRESNEIRHIPVLVMSGLNDRHSVLKAASLGATDFLLKPLRNISLLQKVRKILKVSGTQAFRFPVEQRPKYSISLKAEISAISEAGVDLIMPLKLSSGGEVKLTSELLTELKLENISLRNTLRGGKYTESGLYLNRVNFVGIGEEIAKTIRTFMKGVK